MTFEEAVEANKQQDEMYIKIKNLPLEYSKDRLNESFFLFYQNHAICPKERSVLP